MSCVRSQRDVGISHYGNVPRMRQRFSSEGTETQHKCGSSSGESSEFRWEPAVLADETTSPQGYSAIDRLTMHPTFSRRRETYISDYRGSVFGFSVCVVMRLDCGPSESQAFRRAALNDQAALSHLHLFDKVRYSRARERTLRRSLNSSCFFPYIAETGKFENREII